MFGQPNTVQWRASRIVPRVFVAVVLVAGLAMFMMLTARAAQACPPGKEASVSVRLADKAERVGTIEDEAALAETVALVSSAPVLAEAAYQGGRPCCSDNSYSHKGCCASACCSAFSLAIDVAGSGIIPLDGSVCHVLDAQEMAVPTGPPPDFRPPRSFS